MKDPQYIVALFDISKRSEDSSFRKNYVYKTKKRHSMHPGHYATVLDSKGSITNGWSVANFREATKEEGELYEKFGKPVHIVDGTLESELSRIKLEVNG